MKEQKTLLQKRLHVRLGKLGIIGEKEDIIYNFTNGRTSSSTNMELWELAELVEKLEGESVSLKDDYKYAFFDANNHQHRYLLSLTQEYGWITWNEKLQRDVADLNRLGRWIRNYSQVKKPLLQQDKKELQKTIFQFESMVKKHFATN